MRCKYCGSNVIHPDKQHQTFSKGKAAIGVAAVGVVGAAAGLIGKDIPGYSCGACGAFMEVPMDTGTEMSIDSAIRSAESGTSRSLYDYYKKQYANISANIPQPVQTAPAAQPAETVKIVEVPVEVLPAAPKEKIKCAFKVLSWQRSCPVVIETAIITTTAAGDSLSLRACNLSSGTIRSVYYKVRVLDDTGDEISTISCVYQGLSVAPGASLPADKKFSLNTDIAFRVGLTCEKLAMEDGTVWRADAQEQPVILQDQPILTGENFPRLNYAKMNLSTVSHLEPEHELYLPLQQEDYWQCICGIPVENGCSCPRCGARAKQVTEYLQQDNLRKIAQDHIRSIAAARAKKTAAMYEKAYNSDCDSIYRAAEFQMSKGTIESLRNAAGSFDQLEGWKDATQKAEECRNRIAGLQEQEYQNAVRALEQAESATQCEDAQKRFKVLRSNGNYKDCAEKEKACELKKQKILEEERTKREARYAAEEAQKAATAKKRTIVLICIGAIVVAIIIALVIYARVLIPQKAYNEAVAQMNAGEYEDAIAAFGEVKDYKDAEDQIQKCKYLEAVSMMENGDYDAAIAAFEEMDGYQDSTDQILVCQTAINDASYNAAVALMEEGSYEAAVAAFKEILDYSDSAHQIDLCKEAIKENHYDAATALMENGDYNAAITEFKAIDAYTSYKDVSEMIEQCEAAMKEETYNEAVSLMDNGDYAAALKKLAAIQEYKDTADKISECQTLLYVNTSTQPSKGSGRYYSYEYDCWGNMIKCTEHNGSAEGEIKSVTAYEYDGSGKVIKENEEYINTFGQEVNYETQYVYDEDGKMVSYTVTDSYTTSTYVACEYDESGNATKITGDDVTYYYDSYGNITEKVEYYSSGSIMSKYRWAYVYNSDGDVTSVIEYKNSEETEERQYSYYAPGVMKEQTVIPADGTGCTFTYSYLTLKEYLETASENNNAQ